MAAEGETPKTELKPLESRNEVTNWQIIITAVGAVASMILAVFGSSWLNQQAITRQLELIEKRFDARFEGVDQRLDRVDQRLDRIERQLDQIFKPAFPRQG